MFFKKKAGPNEKAGFDAQENKGSLKTIQC